MLTLLRLLADILWPGLARVIVIASLIAAGFLAGVVVERERGIAQAIDDARRWPWTVGTWSVDR